MCAPKYADWGIVAKAFEKELLDVDDVAGLMGVGQATVWRWCREGSLPCLKVGKHWRVRREAMEGYLRQKERQATLFGRLQAFLQVPDNVLAVAQNLDLIHRLDAAFFRVAEARGGLMVKFYGGETESPDDLRAQLEQEGLEVARLEEQGRLVMRPEMDPVEARRNALGEFMEEEAEGRTVWASFDWAMRVELETAMGQQQKLADLVDARQLVVKTAVLSDAVDRWPAATLRRAQASHLATVFAMNSGLTLGRAMPMPKS